MKNSRPAVTIRKKLMPFREFHGYGSSFMKLTPAQSALVDDFNQKVSQGLVEFESVPCLCGSTVFDLIASVDRHLMRQDTVICTKCGLIQSNPRMTDTESSRFYSSDMYRLCYEGEDYLSIYKDRYSPRHSKHIFDEISKARAIGPGISVLELGAGGGWNLSLFAKVGAVVMGIDYSKSLVELGRQHGFNMKQGGVLDIDGKFDVIIINHVLEHLSDPVGSLRKIMQHLNKGGLMYIAVPNIMNFGMGQLQNAHNYYFIPETFEYYCAMAGLTAVRKGPAQNIHMFGIFSPAGLSAERLLRNSYSKMLFHFNVIKFKFILKKMLSGLHLRKDG